MKKFDIAKEAVRKYLKWILTATVIMIAIFSLKAWVSPEEGQARANGNGSSLEKQKLPPEVAARLRAKVAGLPKYYTFQKNGVGPDGKVPQPCKKMANGNISFVMTGTGWRDLPARSGPELVSTYCYMVETFTWNPLNGKGDCLSQFFRIKGSVEIPVANIRIGSDTVEKNSAFTRTHDILVKAIPDNTPNDPLDNDLAVIGTFQPGCEYLNYTGKFKALEGIP